MKRKLIQLSPSTSVVSLPSKWIKKNRLEKGSEVDVIESDNKMIISTENDKTESEISLDIRKFDGKAMWIYIESAYVTGYDVIKLLTRDHKQTEFMTKVVRYYPGMMILEERNNSVTFKDITGGAREDVDKIINRIFNMNIALLEDSLEAFRSEDWDVLFNSKKRDYTINSYAEYCLRQLNKFGYSNFSKTGIIHTYIKIIEMLSDKICELFIEAGNERKNISEKWMKAFIEIYKNIRLLRTKFSIDAVIEFDEERKKLLEMAEDEDKKLYRHFKQVAGMLFEIEEIEMQLNT